MTPEDEDLMIGHRIASNGRYGDEALAKAIAAALADARRRGREDQVEEYARRQKYGYDGDEETALRIRARVESLTTARSITVYHGVRDSYWGVKSGDLRVDGECISQPDDEGMMQWHAYRMKKAGWPMTELGERLAAAQADEEEARRWGRHV